MEKRESPTSEQEWRDVLTPEEYQVLREKGTEPAFSGMYETETAKGIYRCRACGNELFSSEAKYDAQCGWPTFFVSLGKECISLHEDTESGMERAEARCAKCNSHLGHIFEDGPKEHGGKRYCINSLALDLDEENT